MKRKPMLIDAKDFGTKLREARIKSGKKQSEVAKIVGIAPNSISYYEQGHSIPSLDLAVQLSCSLNVSLDYLVGLKDEF